MISRKQNFLRRRVLKGIAGGVLLPVTAPAGGRRCRLPAARPSLMELVPVLKEITAGAPVREAKVKLEIPHLAENGHLVPLTVT